MSEHTPERAADGFAPKWYHRIGLVVPPQDVQRAWLASDLDRADGRGRVGDTSDPLAADVRDVAHVHLRHVIGAYPVA